MLENSRNIYLLFVSVLRYFNQSLKVCVDFKCYGVWFLPGVHLQTLLNFFTELPKDNNNKTPPK